MRIGLSRLGIVGLVAALVAVAALICGVRLAVGTTTIGPTTVPARFAADARGLIVLAALGIAAASAMGMLTRSRSMTRIAAAGVALLGGTALAEVASCIRRWHAQATRAAIDAGYGSAGARNSYGHGVEIVVAGGLLAILAGVVIAGSARARPQASASEDAPGA